MCLYAVKEALSRVFKRAPENISGTVQQCSDATTRGHQSNLEQEKVSRLQTISSPHTVIYVRVLAFRACSTSTAGLGAPATTPVPPGTSQSGRRYSGRLSCWTCRSPRCSAGRRLPPGRPTPGPPQSDTEHCRPLQDSSGVDTVVQNGHIFKM